MKTSEYLILVDAGHGTADEVDNAHAMISVLTMFEGEMRHLDRSQELTLTLQIQKLIICMSKTTTLGSMLWSFMKSLLFS